jgi:hypothetical protein
MVEAVRGAGIIRAERLLTDSQGALVERLGCLKGGERSVAVLPEHVQDKCRCFCSRRRRIIRAVDELDEIDCKRSSRRARGQALGSWYAPGG